jgi:hypothetical protein
MLHVKPFVSLIICTATGDGTFNDAPQGAIAAQSQVHCGLSSNAPPSRLSCPCLRNSPVTFTIILAISKALPLLFPHDNE